MAATLDILQNVHQSLLLNLLEVVFLGDQILVNTKKKTELKYPATGAFMEFDIWVPSHNLCFEFQDAYHYITTWYSQSALRSIVEKDNTKRLMALQKGITLITIPCWWDADLNSLRETILFHTPESMNHSLRTPPIPLNPLPSHLNINEIPSVGELMLASFPTETDIITSISEDNSWWMGEKYDGIRCCWHPDGKAVYSRQCRVLALLPKLADMLPSVFIDGELWFGRGNFSYSYTFIKGNADVQWPSLRMIGFDNPQEQYQLNAFEYRYSTLLDHITSGHPFTIVASRILCISSAHVDKGVQGIIDGLGEGVILRKCGSVYERGRTLHLLKLKAALGDQEGIVAGIGDDGSVDVKLPNGIMFTVPPTSVAVPGLSLGSVVSFSYESNARREVPVNAVIYRVRTDIEWEDVLESVGSQQRFLNDSSAVSGFTSHPQYHWNLKNMRLMLESIAKNKNMDPLSPETWYNLSSSSIREIKNGRAVLGKFSGYFQAVETLFPELDIDLATYKKVMWEDAAKRRLFFENYASANDFDPLIPENWYIQPKDKIMSLKAASDVLAYHNRSIAEALIALFPNIGLERYMFYWPTWVHSVARTFFENYAAENNFDPLDPKNWYSQLVSKIIDFKGAAAALLPFNGSVRKALMAVFPDIGIDSCRFASATYSTRENRQRFFEDYAALHQFDPKVPDNWYNQSFSKILSCEDASKVMAYHSGSVARALLDLFPDIGLDKKKFHYKSMWSYAKNRRALFEQYARDNGFDPKNVEKWYLQPREKILNVKGMSRLLYYHNSNVAKALDDLFPNFGFDKSKFIKISIWKDVNRRRKFFEEYALANRFDPLQPDQWYSRADGILTMKGISKLLIYHGDSVAKALLDLFPNIGLEKKKFNPKYQTMELAGRRKVFELYAKENNFDPRVASNWYRQPRRKITSFQGAARVMVNYNNSVPKALAELFPDIGLDQSGFLLREMQHKANRRKVFENYAASQGFDPFSAENWYSQTTQQIQSIPNINLVLSYHRNNAKRALLDLFPAIGLDSSFLNFKG